MSALRIKLFGQFNICDETSGQDLIPGKAKELLCYLLIHRQRSLGREFLASILWADCSADNSKQYFRKALWQLQRALPELGVPAESIFQVKGQSVGVNPKADLWVDVIEFERLCSRDQNPSCPADESRLATLKAAADLYRGDLLEGWYQEWCLNDRERLQSLYLMLLDKIVSLSEKNHEYEEGIDYAMRILKCDRAHEVAHQHVMQLRYLSGDRAGALRQYESCAAALKEELDVLPSEQTRQLYRRICEDHMPLQVARPANTMPETLEEASLLQGALNRLLAVKAVLGDLQNTIDESLLHVRQVLQGSGVAGHIE